MVADHFRHTKAYAYPPYKGSPFSAHICGFHSRGGGRGEGELENVSAGGV